MVSAGLRNERSGFNSETWWVRTCTLQGPPRCSNPVCFMDRVGVLFLIINLSRDTLLIYTPYYVLIKIRYIRHSKGRKHFFNIVVKYIITCVLMMVNVQKTIRSQLWQLPVCKEFGYVMMLHSPQFVKSAATSTPLSIPSRHIYYWSVLIYKYKCTEWLK